MKKFKILITSFIVVLVVLAIVLVSYSEDGVILESEDIIRNSSSQISMMLETGESTSIYESSTDTEWPTSGYTFNSTLSKCENGSTLSWDSTNNQVVMNGSTSDRCYVYFDVYVEE